MPFKKLLDGKWILGNKDAIDCCMFRVETGNNLSIFTLDSMFGHRRLMWLFEFIFVVDSMTLVVITFLSSFICFAATSCCGGR